jgi:uncharacterized Fe-S cluster-containing radical SAM superfamily protein
MYDPIERSKRVEKDVCDGTRRKYYRFRPAKWYGGIVTGDVVGCNLWCLFCWAGNGIWGRTDIGDFYEPEEVFEKMKGISVRSGHSQWRLSGQEPTIGKAHLLGLLELVDRSPYTFILETNGILLDTSYANALAGFGKVHVRVSLKGSSDEEFTRLTGAPGGFNLQLKSLSNLVDAGVSCHPAVMSAFSEAEDIRRLKDSLASIDKGLSGNLEVEELIEYPHVKRRLRARRWPRGARTVQTRLDE